MANCKHFYYHLKGFWSFGADTGCIRFGENNIILFDRTMNYRDDYCSKTVDAFQACPLSDPETVVEKTRMPGFCQHCSYYDIRNPLAPGGICTYADVAKTAGDGCIIGKSIAT